MTKTLPILKWIGTIAGAAGALLISLNIPESGWAFVFFLISSMAWTGAGIVMRDIALWTLNLVFVAIDIIGIIRWIIVPANG